MVQSQSIAVPITAIRTDGGTQPRAELSNDLVAEYAAGLLCGDSFPPITVFYDGADYWLADGFHRLEAHRQRGTTEVEPDIRQGTRRDAVLYACGANAKHGLRRTSADKRRSVETLLHDEEWAQWSDREIARRTSTSAPFVAKIRELVTVNVYSDQRTYNDRHGNTSTMNTARIGSNGNGHASPSDNAKTKPLTPYEQEIMARHYPYTCDTCGERFGQPIWHCPGCDHHYHQEDEECGNCHNYTRDGQRITAEEEDEEDEEPVRADPIAVHFTSDSPEWYTPRDIIDRAIVVLGHIDLDPCSNSADPAKANVPAGKHFDKPMDGLVHQWFGRVYMNPPYGDEIADWVDRLIWHYDHDYVDEAIALIPARTDTAWFRPFKKRFPCCFIDGRLKFLSPDGAKNSAPFPSVVIYLGIENKVQQFEEAFRDIGSVMIPYGLRDE